MLTLDVSVPTGTLITNRCHGDHRGIRTPLTPQGRHQLKFRICLNCTYILATVQFYLQIHGVAMDSHYLVLSVIFTWMT